MIEVETVDVESVQNSGGPSKEQENDGLNVDSLMASKDDYEKALGEKEHWIDGKRCEYRSRRWSELFEKCNKLAVAYIKELEKVVFG